MTLVSAITAEQISHPNEPNIFTLALGFSDGRILKTIELFWKVLWSKRATFFQRSVLCHRVTFTGDTKEVISLGAVVSDCLYQMGEMWDGWHRIK